MPGINRKRPTVREFVAWMLDRGDAGATLADIAVRFGGMSRTVAQILLSDVRASGIVLSTQRMTGPPRLGAYPSVYRVVGEVDLDRIVEVNRGFNTSPEAAQRRIQAKREWSRLRRMGRIVVAADDVDDWPVVQRVVPIAKTRPPMSAGPRSVFEYGIRRGIS